MLVSAHAEYELKKNIMSAGVCVGSWGHTSEVRAGVLAGRLGVKACLPGGAQGERGSLSLVEDLTMKKGVSLPCANWSEAGTTFLMSPR